MQVYGCKGKRGRLQKDESVWRCEWVWDEAGWHGMR